MFMMIKSDTILTKIFINYNLNYLVWIQRQKSGEIAFMEGNEIIKLQSIKERIVTQVIKQERR